jgi:hypothetical protein
MFRGKNTMRVAREKSLTRHRNNRVGSKLPEYLFPQFWKTLDGGRKM